MPFEIYSRLETLLAVTGLNGPVAKAEAAAEAQELENALVHLQQIESGIFLTQAQGEYLQRFQNQIRPMAAKCTAEDMVQKMTVTPKLFPLSEAISEQQPAEVQCTYSGKCLILSGITAQNYTDFADFLRLLRNFFPPFFGMELGGSGVPWSVFDAQGNSFYACDRAGLSWRMIHTIGEET